MNNVAFTVALISAYYVSRDPNVNIPNQLLSLCHDFESHLFQPYMTCLSQIIMRIPSDQLNLDPESSLQLVTNCLQPSIDPIYSSSAMKILFALVENVGAVDSLKNLAGNICQAISSFSGDTLFQALSDLNIFTPKHSDFFSDILTDIIQVLLEISLNTENAEQSRMKALLNMNILILQMPSLCSDFLGDIIEGIIRIGCEVTIEDYLLSDEDFTYSQYALDRLGEIILDDTLAPLAISICNEAVSQLLSSYIWENTYVGIVILEKIIRAGSDYTISFLGDYISLILPHVTDEAPIIRTAACNTLSIASTIYQPTIQNQYASTIIPVFVQLIDQDADEKSCCVAIRSLSEFCQFCTPTTLEEYCDQILAVIVNHGLADGNEDFQSNVIGCVNVFIPKLKKPFLDNYNQLLITIISNLQTMTDKPNVRARTLEMIYLKNEYSLMTNEITDLMSLFLSWDWELLSIDEYQNLTKCVLSFSMFNTPEFINFAPEIMNKLILILMNAKNPTVHPEFQSDFIQNSDTIPLLCDNSVIEISKSEISKLKSTILTIDRILSVIGTQNCITPFWGQIKKVYGDCMLLNIYPTLPECAIHCFVRFFSLYNEIDDEKHTKLQKFGSTFINICLKLANITANMMILATIVRHLRFSVVKLANFGVLDSQNLLNQIFQIDELVESKINKKEMIDTERDCLDSEIGEFLAMWLKLFPNDSETVLSNLIEKYPINFENTRPLTLDIWVLWFTISQCQDERLHSDLIKCVFNQTGSPSIYVTLNAFLCLNRLARFTQLNEETLQDAVVTVISSLDRSSISNNKEIVGSAMIALSSLLQNLEKETNENLLVFVDKFPLTTNFEDIDITYSYFLSLIESEQFQMDKNLMQILINVMVFVSNNEIISLENMNRLKTVFQGITQNESLVHVLIDLLQNSDMSTQKVFSSIM
ncbi:hypothetical protein TVAG_161220 [Trichomonas vaginalis G3]|uniref:HEAT repeat family protein n=1 Tax=Trichomonas vaginalis (strain ATCC PRA-98 / G3) TaxID=412133 RepID=A2E4X7_TRIV3|nr:importin beta family [Trichomonas vaginalis G3]EAY12316.1 hypothetical protein TVAG_161220 [Trichomonas vaginalis G3]KAI5552444.1 importin beta family [Trichomonas vaginalis G3]|eukprot:XP_001324539.1 hypothetical protein [Trichomonas vaginalis G3]